MSDSLGQTAQAPLSPDLEEPSPRKATMLYVRALNELPC